MARADGELTCTVRVSALSIDNNMPMSLKKERAKQRRFDSCHRRKNEFQKNQRRKKVL